MTRQGAQAALGRPVRIGQAALYGPGDTITVAADGLGQEPEAAVDPWVAYAGSSTLILIGWAGVVDLSQVYVPETFLHRVESGRVDAGRHRRP